MRIDSVTAHAFGPLAGDTLKFAPGMTVVIGENESAKTSWHAAIYAALCGRARRKGRPGADEQWFIDRHKPWDAPGWEVSARLTLDDGREIEMRQDLAGNVACSATDLQRARDISNEIMEDGSPDAASWLGLDRRSFVATACIHQTQLLHVLDEAEGMQKILQRATSTAGADATAAEALTRLDQFQKSQVGRDDARSARPLRLAVLELERATRALEQSRIDHAEYLRAVEDVERLRSIAARAQNELALHEAAAARKLVDDYGARCERASTLQSQLGDTPPQASTLADALGTQVARALQAWGNGAQAVELTGPPSKDLRALLNELPTVPAGDLAVDPALRSAYEKLIRAGQTLAAQEDARPPVPETILPGVAQDEILALAHTLEMGVSDAGNAESPRLDELGVEIGQLEASGRRARIFVAVGAGLVVIGAVLAVLGSPVLSVLALLGIASVTYGLLTQKAKDLREARGQHAQLSIQVAGARESAARFAQDRSRAEARCVELGVSPAAVELRGLAAAISRNETFAERNRLFEEQRLTLTSERDDTDRELRDALAARGVPNDGNTSDAFDAYADGCEERARVAARAAQRPSLEDQLRQRMRAEEMAADRQSALVAAERQIGDALSACGLHASTAAEGAATLEQWERRRQDDLTALDAKRADWSELESLLGGRTFIELTEAYQAANADAERRADGLDAREVAALAAGEPASRLGELRGAASAAGEAAAAAEGAIGERAKDLTSVSEAEEAEEAARERLSWLKDLDAVLAKTQHFLADAQERVQRDLAPVLAATLAAWLPRITGGRYSDAIIDIDTLEVQVCGEGGRWRSAKRLSQEDVPTGVDFG